MCQKTWRTNWDLPSPFLHEQVWSFRVDVQGITVRSLTVIITANVPSLVTHRWFTGLHTESYLDTLEESRYKIHVPTSAPNLPLDLRIRSFHWQVLRTSRRTRNWHLRNDTVSDVSLLSHWVGRIGPSIQDTYGPLDGPVRYVSPGDVALEKCFLYPTESFDKVHSSMRFTNLYTDLHLTSPEITLW